MEPNKKNKITELYLANEWEIELLVDDDGDLNIYLPNNSTTRIVEMNGDSCSPNDELHYRFARETE